MAHIEKSIFINAPVEKVFDFIAEPNNLPRWDFMAVEIRERSEGPAGIGTTFIEVTKMPGGIKIKCPSRVTECSRPHRLVIEVTSTGMLLTLVHKLQIKNSGTLITIAADSAVRWGFLGKAIDKLFIGRFLAGNTERIVSDLKTVMERAEIGA